MSYEEALAKAWLDLGQATQEKRFSIRLLSDEYDVDVENNRVLSLACNVAAKDHISILILHYLIKKLKGLASVKNKWISFRELPGGEGYFAAFKKRVIEPIVRKYGPNPGALLDLPKRFKAKRAEMAQAVVELDVFENVPFLISVEPKDEEFSASANISFDENIKDIFCTEDAVVLAEFVARQI